MGRAYVVCLMCACVYVDVTVRGRERNRVIEIDGEIERA